MLVPPTLASGAHRAHSERWTRVTVACLRQSARRTRCSWRLEWLEMEKPGILSDTGLQKADDGLLSRNLSIAVPSALQGLTAVFGMGTGVAPAR